jgi:hypothetical protein
MGSMISMISMGYWHRLGLPRRRVGDHVLMTRVMITGGHLMRCVRMIKLFDVRCGFR